MKRPNCFIVGAPKCGTTALWEHLSQHSNIFFPDTKEPHCFAGDLRDANRGSAYRETLAGYLALFSKAGERHRVVGEASVFYLSAAGALERILEFEPSAKIVAMVRNPVDVAHSLHNQQVMDYEESILDFEQAWRAQSRRKSGELIPDTNGDPGRLQYEEVCRLGAQVSRLSLTVPAAQLLVLVFDDLLSTPGEVYADVLRFVEIPHDGRTAFYRINERESHEGGESLQISFGSRDRAEDVDSMDAQ